MKSATMPRRSNVFGYCFRFELKNFIDCAGATVKCAKRLSTIFSICSENRLYVRVNSGEISPQPGARRKGKMTKPSYYAPMPTNASKISVSRFAEHIAKDLKFNPGDPIEPVVSALGGAISFKNPVGSEKPDSIRVQPDGTYQIFLSTMTSQKRDRFTIAHELGHFFLHFPLVQKANPGAGMRATRWVDDSDPIQQRCEWEANWFAASFIMPEREFRDSYRIGGITSVAEDFDVSGSAAEVRARSLGLL
jgi:hypothetical protein